jgi:hypothetical protein
LTTFSKKHFFDFRVTLHIVFFYQSFVKTQINAETFIVLSYELNYQLFVKTQNNGREGVLLPDVDF